MKLLLPAQDSAVISQAQENRGDTIVAHLADPGAGPGLVVEITSRQDKVIWRHDFGYNSSAAPGCSTSVALHPTLPAVLVKYSGYKWDHETKLLFINNPDTSPTIKEYTSAAADCTPLLRHQSGWNPDFQYLITPASFHGESIRFSCVPLEKSEKQSAHPYAQGETFYNITAKLEADFKITPQTATANQ